MPSAALPQILRQPANDRILRTIDGRSAHSDVVLALLTATRPLAGVRSFSPDGAAFGYVVLYTDERIFALVDGMQGPTMQLPAVMFADQIALGAVARPEYGPDWLLLPLYAGLDFQQHLPALARAAYRHAK